MNKLSLQAALDKIRFDEIEAKKQYFAEEMNNKDQEFEFSQKYEEFKNNYIEQGQSRNKEKQTYTYKGNQVELADNQSKLIQTIIPGVQLDDVANKLLAQITMVYMEELIENSKICSLKDGTNKIKPEHVKEILRAQDFRSENKSHRQFADFFN